MPLFVFICSHRLGDFFAERQDDARGLAAYALAVRDESCLPPGRRIAARRALVDPARALDPTPSTLPRGGTTYLCAVDADGTAISLIQSVYETFGSGIVAPGTGVVLQNRAAGFVEEEGHPNRLAPSRRPFHTIIPAMVTKDERPWFVFGVMGGDMQPQGHVQVLVNMLDFGMGIQAAGDAPRIEHIGSATPTGKPELGVGTIQAEPSVKPEVVAELKLGRIDGIVIRARRD